MPGEGTETGAPGIIQGSAEGQSNEIQERPGEGQEYDLQNAVDEAFDDQDKQNEPPAKSTEDSPPTETSQGEPKPEDKPTEDKPVESRAEDKPVAKESEIPAEYQEAKKFYDALKNPDYQKQLLQNLASMHGMKLTDGSEAKVEAPPVSPEQAKFKEIMDSLDPEVKAIFDHIQTSANDRISRLEAYIEKQEKDAQEARITKAKNEFNEFVSSNKEAMDKYKPQLDSLAKKIPGIFSGGKDGLKAALDLVSMEDRIKDAVDKATKEAISKTLGRSERVAETVQHHASSVSQQRESHASGGESFNTIEEALDATVKQLAGAI